MAETNSIAIPVRVKDLTGHVYENWTVIQYAGFFPNTKKATWLCECRCGTRKVVRASNLKSGMSCDCGCGRRQKTILRNTTHGRARSPEYITWCGMIGRCYNPSNPRYKDYGDRGITVCDRWKNSFETFFRDMGEKPSNKHSIDRIDVNGIYEPSNCRWVTATTQARNTRRNVKITIGDETKCVSEWAKQEGIDPITLGNRVSRGWRGADLLRPPITGKVLELHGRKMTAMEWSKETGISFNTIYDRLSAGWTVEDALCTRPKPSTRLLMFRGKTQSITCWAKELGINASTISHRLGRGYSVEQALSKR